MRRDLYSIAAEGSALIMQGAGILYIVESVITKNSLFEAIPGVGVLLGRRILQRLVKKSDRLYNEALSDLNSITNLEYDRPDIRQDEVLETIAGEEKSVSTVSHSRYRA